LHWYTYIYTSTTLRSRLWGYTTRSKGLSKKPGQVASDPLAVTQQLGTDLGFCFTLPVRTMERVE